MSYKVQKKIPSISDYFSPSNMTVKNFTDLMQNSSLPKNVEVMKNKVKELAKELDRHVCNSTELVNPAKLRNEVEKGDIFNI